MLGFQFVNVNSYSNARPKTRTRRGKTTGTTARKWNAADVLDEATRKPEACKHVEKPEPPNWVLGSREEVETAGKEWHAGTKYGKRRVRSDSPWLAAGVASLPASRKSEWLGFRDDVVRHLVEKYGDRLRGLVEHLDESNPHLHFYSVPKPGENFGVVHQGFAAKTEARQAGLQKVGTAFVHAMQRFQDEFYEAVGKVWGLARFGPMKGRKTRAEWKTNQAEAEAEIARMKVQVARDEAQEVIVNAKMQAAEIIKRTVEIEIPALLNEAKTQARAIIDQAKKEAGVVVQVETKRIREKGAQYFGKARDDLRNERRQAREEARQITETLQNGSDGLRRLDVYATLADMRMDIKTVENALKQGKLVEAEKVLQAAKEKDPAPAVQGPKISGWNLPKPSP